MAEFDNDADLEMAVEEVDLFLTQFCMKYKAPPLLASSVFLARLASLNQLSDTMNDFGNLLSSIVTKIETKELEPKKGIVH